MQRRLPSGPMKSSKYIFVYELKTTACRKSYIGLTTDPKKRLKAHKRVERHKWKTLTKCGRAVKRYGAHTFFMVLLAKTYDEERALSLESQFIKARGKKRLWNSNTGGSYPTKERQRKRRKTLCEKKNLMSKKPLSRVAKRLESKQKSLKDKEREEELIESSLSLEESPSSSNLKSLEEE